MANLQVETFEIEEVTAPAQEEEAVEAEAIELVGQLGLKGQETLLIRSPNGEGTVRIPYPEMSRAEKAVYEALFPEATLVEKYDCGIIPVRVLQVVAYAKESGMFESGIYVWHDKVPNPDPVLVGRKGKDYAWKYYLLARWGHALAPFKELVAAARERMMVHHRARLEKEIAERQTSLACLAGLVDQKLLGEWVNL